MKCILFLDIIIREDPLRGKLFPAEEESLFRRRDARLFLYLVLETLYSVCRRDHDGHGLAVEVLDEDLNLFSGDTLLGLLLRSCLCGATHGYDDTH